MWFREIDVLDSTLLQKWVVLNGLLILVYGAAQDAQTTDFLSELARICQSSSLPMLVKGDFNIIQK